MSRRGGMGEIMPGCFAVPQNPFYQRMGPNCKGNMPMGRISSGQNSIPMAVNTGLNTSGPVAQSSVGIISVAPSSDLSTLPAATTQVNPNITQTAVGFGSGRGGYGDGVYHWQGGYAYQNDKGAYNDGWNGNASKIPLSPANLLEAMPSMVTGIGNEASQVMCSGFTGWVASNPMLAAAALVGLFFVMRGK
jgi:hypothetical protein